jgi:hypothetical protein
MNDRQGFVVGIAVIGFLLSAVTLRVDLTSGTDQESRDNKLRETVENIGGTIGEVTGRIATKLDNIKITLEQSTVSAANSPLAPPDYRGSSDARRSAAEVLKLVNGVPAADRPRAADLVADRLEIVRAHYRQLLGGHSLSDLESWRHASTIAVYERQMVLLGDILVQADGSGRHAALIANTSDLLGLDY